MSSNVLQNVSSLLQEDTKNETEKNQSKNFSNDVIIYLSVNSFILLMAFYFSVSLAVYLRYRQRISSCKYSSSNCGTKKATYSTPLQQLCVATALVLMLTTLCGFAAILLLQFYHNYTYCDWLSKIHHVVRTLTEILFNTILWLRQKIFYQHPVMRDTSSWITSTISWLFYVIMIISTCFSLFVFLFGFSPSFTDGCVMIQNFDIFWFSKEVVLGITISLIVLYRLLFLGLLIYPLIKYRRESNLHKPKHASQMMNVIRRVLVADCLCISIFIVVAVLTDYLTSKSVLLLLVLWEGELVLGFIFIMLSFADWRKRLFPFCTKDKELRRSFKAGSNRSTIWSVA